MLSSVGFSGVDVLLICPWFHGVENPSFVACHFQDVFDVPHLWSYPPLISSFLLLVRVSLKTTGRQIIEVIRALCRIKFLSVTHSLVDTWMSTVKPIYTL